MEQRHAPMATVPDPFANLPATIQIRSQYRSANRNAYLTASGILGCLVARVRKTFAASIYNCMCRGLEVLVQICNGAEKVTELSAVCSQA